MKNLLLFFALLILAPASAQTMFWEDDMEGAGGPNLGGGTRTPSLTFSSGGPPATRYFFRTPLSGINTSFSVTGIQGTNCWAAEDVDNGNLQTAHQNVTWTGINISGRTGLQFRGLFGTGGATGAFDNTAVSGNGTDYMIAEYRIDGGPWTSAVRFLPISTVASTLLGLETTGDSIGENVSTLSNTMQEFQFNISGTGTTMEIRVKVFCNSLVEEMIFDDIRLYEVPTCSNPTITTQPSNASVCNNGNTSFSIAATGATSYQWQVNCGSGFSNVTNGGVYSGATTATLTITGATTGMNGCIYRCLAQQSPCSSTSNNATLTVSTPALTALSQTNVACNGGTNGAASVNAAGGGVSPYTYNWTPGNPIGDGTTSVTGLTAGTWTCTVTDNIGCTASQTFNITQPSAIILTAASQTNVSCFGGTNGAASVNAATGGAGGFTYNWTPGNPTGDGTVSVTGLIAGTWTCTATDANSCTATRTFNITSPTALVVTPASQTNISCNGGNNGAASINTPTGGAGGYTYNWTPGNPTGDGTVSVTGLTAGSWTCTVTDANSCTATQTFNVTAPTALVVTPASQTNVACNGGSTGAASINTPTGGAGGYTYNWTPGNPTGDGTVSVTGLTAGSWTCTVTDANSCTATQTFNITAPTAITANISSTPTSCTANTGTATVSSVTGGAGGYTYSWAPTGGTAATATGLSSGTYTCTITDANACNITRTVVVGTSSGPSLTAASQTNVACFGGASGAASVNAATGGTAPYTYNWTPGNPTGDGTVSVTGLTAGSWTCTVTDAGGCTAVVTFNITSPTAIVLNANAQTNVSCFGGTNGAASVTAATGGAGGYTYNWTPGNPTGDGTVSVTGLTAGTWTCTVTDANSCTATQTFNITSPSAIVVTPASQTNISCNGGTNGAASINTPTGGAGGFTYNWTPGNPTGDGTVSVTGLTAGTWTCTVTDANACTATATFNITAPTALNASISSTPTSCSANTGTATVSGVSGGAGGYTYSWAPTGGTAATATGLAAGTYTCTITDANSCTLTRTVTVGGVAAPTLTALSQTNVSCFGGSNGAASVNAATGGSSPYTYNWTPGNPTGDGTTSVTGLTAGSWTCTVTDNNGCTATATFNITSPSAIALTATATPTVICAGQSTMIAASATGGSGSFSYVWTPGSLNGPSHTVTPTTTTTYTVVTTDANTCTASTVLTVSVNPLPSVTLSGTNHFCPGGSTLLTGTSGGTSQWYLNGVAIVGATNNTYLATLAGVYNMRKTNTNGCGDSAAVGITVTIDTPPAITSVTSSAVLCFGDSNGSATVSATGTPSLSYSWAPTGGTSTTASGLAAGNYTVTVTDGNTCTSTATVAVTSPAVLTTLPSQVNATCFGGNDASASVAVTGGTAMYTYLWTPVLPPSPSANSLTAGSYSCLVTDMNGCTSTATFNITEPALITTSQSVTICNGDSLVVGASVYSTAGTYIDTLTSTLGCDSIVTTALAVNPVPSVISVTSAAVCDSGTVTLGAAASGGANLIWYSDSTLTTNVSSGNSYTTPLLFTTTTYYVQADSAGCYSAVVPVTVTVNTGAVTINQSLTLCFGDSVTIGSNTYYASGVYADTINFGGCDSIFNSTITVLNQITATQTLTICSGQSVTVGTNSYTATGIYMDTLAAVNGCDSLVTTDLTVTLPDSSAQAVTVCNGGSYSIGANTYTASGVYADTLTNINGCDSVVTTTLTVLPANIVNQNITLCAGDSINVGNSVYYTAGTYADTIADINGCDSIINTVVNINTVDVSVTVTGFGGTLMSNASGPNTSWLWLNCQDNTPIISATMQSYSPSANGQFAVIVTQSGCTDTSTCFSINSVGIDENSATNFSIYPNPANDIITVQTQIGATIVILDAIGNQVAASKATNTKTDIAVDQLANGIYFVKVISDNQDQTQKLIISK
ncbi:MAG: T9SS type A sorting domain-containing protein [Bacteroidia bacterium]|nr:T9SS type A sorting domain-containing protein [Bacteroidia bacterium]